MKNVREVTAVAKGGIDLLPQTTDYRFADRPELPVPTLTTTAAAAWFDHLQARRCIKSNSLEREDKPMRTDKTYMATDGEDKLG
jgi:hypothetical protein